MLFSLFLVSCIRAYEREREREREEREREREREMCLKTKRALIGEKK